ncbi:hypothetical protein RCL1_002517 [Eukaryota sp. TZLM3-RCL]
MEVLNRLILGEIPIDKVFDALDEAFFGPDHISLKSSLKSSSSSCCTLIWHSGDVAFSCEDCNRDETSAICVSCFLRGPHQKDGHQWRLLKVQAGRCDCGSEGIRSTGYCSEHSLEHRTNPLDAIPSNLHSSNTFISSLYTFIEQRIDVLDFLRDSDAFTTGNVPQEDPSFSPSEDSFVSIILQWLQQLSEIHEAFRIISAHPLSNNPNLLLKLFLLACCPSNTASSISDLLFSFLVVDDFKKQCAMVLSSNYYLLLRITAHYRLIKASDKRFKDKIFANFGVQVFTVVDIIPTILKENNGQSFLSMLEGFSFIVKASKLDPVLFSPFVNHVGSDLLFLLNYVEVRQFIYSSPHLFDCIFDFVTTVCQENRSFTYKRRSRSEEYQVEEEVPDRFWSRSISVQLFLIQILSRLFGEQEFSMDLVTDLNAEGVELAKKVAKIVVDFINNYPAQEFTILKDPVSLHLPAHRVLSFLFRLVNAVTPLDPLEIAPFEFWQRETLAVSQAFAFSSFVSAGIFRKNGVHPVLETKERHSSLSLFRDLDLLFLQICAHVAVSHQKTDEFITILGTSYSIWNSQVFKLDKKVDEDVDRHTFCAYEFFLLCYRIAVERISTMSLLQRTTYDVRHLLASKDRPYSQILKSLVVVELSKHTILSKILNEISIFKEPTEVASGSYSLKSNQYPLIDVTCPHLSAEKLELLSQRVKNTNTKSLFGVEDLAPNFSTINKCTEIVSSRILLGLCWISALSAFQRSSQMSKPVHMALKVAFLACSMDQNVTSLDFLTKLSTNPPSLSLPLDPGAAFLSPIEYCHTKLPIKKSETMSLIDLFLSLRQSIPHVNSFFSKIAPHLLSSITDTPSATADRAKKLQNDLMARLSQQQNAALLALEAQFSEEEQEDSLNSIVDSAEDLLTHSRTTVGNMDLTEAVCAYCRQSFGPEDSFGMFCNVARTAKLDFVVAKRSHVKLKTVEQLLAQPTPEVSHIASDTESSENDDENEDDEEGPIEEISEDELAEMAAEGEMMWGSEEEEDMEEAEDEEEEQDEEEDAMAMTIEHFLQHGPVPMDQEQPPEADGAPNRMRRLGFFLEQFAMAMNAAHGPGTFDYSVPSISSSNTEPVREGDGRFGACLSSCRHFIHSKCFVSFSSTLGDSEDVSLNPNSGEFRCPMCRMLSNAVVPVFKSKSVSKYVAIPSCPNIWTNFLNDGISFLKDPIRDLVTDEKVEISGADNHLFSSLVSHVISSTSGQSYSSVELGLPPSKALICLHLAKSIAHTVSCLEISCRKSDQSKMIGGSNFYSLKALLRALLITFRSSELKWEEIVDKFFTEGQIHLDFDPLVALILIGAHSKTAFTSIFCLAFLLTVTRGTLASTSASSASEFDLPDDLDPISAQIASNLIDCSIAILGQDHSLPSPQLIAKFVVPFLRRAQLFFSIAFEDVPADNLLDSNHLKLISTLISHGDLLGTNPANFVANFSKFLPILQLSPSVLAKPMSSEPQPFNEFSIAILPEYYHHLYFGTKDTECSLCKAPSSNPALCLSCGELICASNKRDFLPELDTMAGEVWRHCYSCTGGVGAFLLLKTCEMRLLQHGRRATGNDIYLDPHGESDANLLRGLPLTLHPLRVSSLERQLVNFDFSLDPNVEFSFVETFGL